MVNNIEPGETHAQTKRTAGEKRFDWITYGGIGYLANVVVSIGAIWAADRTHTGKRIIDGIAKSTSKISGIPFDKIRPQVRFTSLLTGGFAVLLPIKWREDHKIDDVTAYDAKYYKNKLEHADFVAQAHARLKHEPKQSWMSVIGSRFLAMVPFYTFTGIAMKEGQWLAKQTNGKIYGERLITRAARGIDKLIHRNNKEALAELALKEQLSANRTMNDLERGIFERRTTALADYTITEATTSGIVAGFLYVFTRLTAPFLGHQPNPADTIISPSRTIALLKQASSEGATLAADRPTITIQAAESEAHKMKPEQALQIG